MYVASHFTGRSVLLTVGTGGIGHAIAWLFNGSGADLLLADLDAEALDRSTAG